MRIYKMQATFGKLENQTLELQPGLNIIEVPNEGGKSTWCAFLVAMLYGIETRARTTKDALAEKEKYAPWSGSPMEGRIDLNWDGRDITIERRTKGRTPFGVFNAYETATGLQVPELTGANCGLMLLGVEKSVFARTGFLRLNDLPVTQDEALRRRLNALVTTGDESGAGDALGTKLKELKNACRYNRTGLLPRAEAELAGLEEKQRTLDRLEREAEENALRQEQTEQYLSQLKNHKTALRYQAALADRERVRLAEEAFSQASDRREKLEAECATLPDREAAEEKRRQVSVLQQQWMALQAERQSLPPEPEAPECPPAFADAVPAALQERVRDEAKRYAVLREKAEKKPILGWTLMILGLVGVAACAALQIWIGLAVSALMLAAGMVVYSGVQKQRKDAAAEAEALASRYPWREPARWLSEAENYVNCIAQYREQRTRWQTATAMLDGRGEEIRSRLHGLTRGRGLGSVLEELQKVLDTWNELEDARQDLKQAENYLQDIRAMAKPAQMPSWEDQLTYSEGETDRLLSEYTVRQGQLREQQGKIHGVMNAISDRQTLQNQIDALKKRISDLEEMAEALDTAQHTLEAATEQLQRRFAPRITERAKDLFAQLTDGRYDRLSLTRDLAVDTAAAGELTLHSAQWRSEGTVDQLYIALRLAVAEELTPDAPLVLDDALVRFDDKRLNNALKVLTGMAESCQVILFTCQSREKELYRQ